LLETTDPLPPLPDPEEPPLADPEEPPLADPEEPPLADPEEPPLADPEEPPLADPEEPPLADPEEPPLADPPPGESRLPVHAPTSGVVKARTVRTRERRRAACLPSRRTVGSLPIRFMVCSFRACDVDQLSLALDNQVRHRCKEGTARRRSLSINV